MIIYHVKRQHKKVHCQKPESNILTQNNLWRRQTSPNEIEIREFRLKGVYKLKMGGDSVSDQKEDSFYRRDVQIQSIHQDTVIWDVRIVAGI